MIPIDELDELHAGILAYWQTLDQDGEPSAVWKRWTWQMLFGVPCLADGEQPRVPMTHPALIVAEAQDTLPILAFHLEYLVDNGAGPMARLLWERVQRLAGDVLLAMERIEAREEGAA